LELLQEQTIDGPPCAALKPNLRLRWPRAIWHVLLRRRRRHQHTNIRHFSRLLCARRERPRDRRAAKERDQLAPPHLSYLVGFAYPERRDARRKKVSGSVLRARRRFCPDLPWYAYGDRAPCSSEKVAQFSPLDRTYFVIPFRQPDDWCNYEPRSPDCAWAIRGLLCPGCRARALIGLRSLA